MNITILGNGAWGRTIGNLLYNNNHNITLYDTNKHKLTIDKSQYYCDNKFLLKIPIHNQIKLINNLECAIYKSEIIVIAIPTQFQRNTLIKLKSFYNKDKQYIVNISKGIEQNSLKFIHQIVFEIIGCTQQYATLSGPSHAEEVYNNKPTQVLLASNNNTTLTLIKNIFESKNFQIKTTNDVIGTELCGALKNIYAIVFGICNGLHAGDNSKAVIITKCIAEMLSFGQYIGCQEHTFIGLSGIGDLIATCYTTHSRNKFVGEQLVNGIKIKAIINILQPLIAEGITTTQSGYFLMKKYNLHMPLITLLYNMMFNNEIINIDTIINC